MGHTGNPFECLKGSLAREEIVMLFIVPSLGYQDLDTHGTLILKEHHAGYLEYAFERLND